MKHENQPKHDLDAAIEGLRVDPGGPERLSGRARAAIVEAAMSPRTGPPRLPRLFVPWSRLATAVVPAMVVSLALGWLAVDRGAPRAATVEVAKVGGQVVFTIANGGRSHRVIKSERPDSFDRTGQVEREDGTFVDRLDSGADVVFYRID